MPRSSRQSHEDLQTIVKRRKLQWHGHVSRSSGLANTILQGTVKGGRKQGGQRKRWEDNIREGSGDQGKMEKTGCKIICGAPTTLAVKGLMMMMMNHFDNGEKKDIHDLSSGVCWVSTQCNDLTSR